MSENFSKTNELGKILSSNQIDKAALINLFPVVKEVDEFEFYHPAHIYGILDHSIKAADLTKDIFLRTVLIFHDIGKIKTAKQVPHKTEPNTIVTKFPGHEEQSVKMAAELFNGDMDPVDLHKMLLLIKYHDTQLVRHDNLGDDYWMFDHLIKQHGTGFMHDLLDVKRCDQLSHNLERYLKKIEPEIEKVYIRLQLLKIDEREKKLRKTTVSPNISSLHL